MNLRCFLAGFMIAGWVAFATTLSAQTLQVASPVGSPGAATSLNDTVASGMAQPVTGQSYFQGSHFQGGNCCQCGNCGGGCQNGEVWATITPYFWLPAMKGQLGAGSALVNVDLSLSDTWDLLSDLKGAAMVHLEIGRGGRGLIVDTLLTEFASSETLPSGALGTAETSMTFLEGLGFRRIYSQDRCGQFVRGVNWDMLYGVRYYQVGMELEVVPPAGPNTVVERTENWVDLVLGTRTSMKLANGGTAFARADFGGFGLGSSSDLAWNLHLGLENRMRRYPNTSSVIGYKILDIKQSKGAGADAFLFDMTLQGPFAALMFRF